MATLMSWGTRAGTKGRCDAKCHNATSRDCDCMCGGRYHGGGTDGTLKARVQEFGADVLVAAKARAKAQGMELTVARFEDVFGQKDLF